VEVLTGRLRGLAVEYLRRFSVDVRSLPGSGAAGGLGGGLAALGASLEPGFALIADVVALAAAIGDADLVMTGEGRLDEQSFDGKVVGGVAALATEAGVPWCAVVGQAVVQPEDGTVVDLVTAFGQDAALHRTLTCLRAAARDHLSALR
jgi:glycerate kinase